MKIVRPKTIIHVNIRSSNRKTVVDRDKKLPSVPMKRKSRHKSRSVSVTRVQQSRQTQSHVNTRNDQKYRNSIISTIRGHLINSSKVDVCQSGNSHDQHSGWLSEMGMTKDFHRSPKKKKKYSNKCIIGSILTIVILCLILLTILLVLLIRPKSEEKNIVLRWNTSAITVAGVSGVSGNDSDHLNAPWDVILDYNNSIYVADRDNNRVQKYLRNSLTGTTIAGQANGIGGTSSNELLKPFGLMLDLNGNLYVCDANNNRIQLWTKGASTGITVAGTGAPGTTNNAFSLPYGIAGDLSSNTFYIADYGNHRVMRYSSGATTGTVVAGGNGGGNTSTQLLLPAGLYFDSLTNSFVIANHGAHNVVRWVSGANSWTLLAGDFFGYAGNSATRLSRPVDMTFDPMGNMYVADRNNHRIQLFLTGQMEGITIAGVTSVGGNNASLLNRPFAITLDNQLNLYVADSNNHRIQKFQRY